MRNYEGMAAVGTIFNWASIQRLKPLWAAIPKKVSISIIIISSISISIIMSIFLISSISSISSISISSSSLFFI